MDERQRQLRENARRLMLVEKALLRRAAAIEEPAKTLRASALALQARRLEVERLIIPIKKVAPKQQRSHPQATKAPTTDMPADPAARLVWLAKQLGQDQFNALLREQAG